MKYYLLIIFIAYFQLGFSQEKSKPINENSGTEISETKTAWLLSSNFTVPTVAFQPTLKDYRELNIKEPRGNLSFFNSIGAGISISRSSFKILSSKNDTTGLDINNQVGFQLGFLFGRNATGTEEKNRFAVQIGFSILDFQFGFGKEFVSVPQNFNSKFITVAYGIPLAKFTKKSAFVLKNKGNKGSKKLSKIHRGFSI